MDRSKTLQFALTFLALGVDAQAHGSTSFAAPRPPNGARPQHAHFRRIGTFANYVNTGDLALDTVSEIVAANADGTLLLYTDSPREALGFVDLTSPATPAALGQLSLEGEPTSVATVGNDLAIVAVDTTGSQFTSPSGHLALVDLKSRTLLGQLALGGQPDSVAVSRDRRYAAVAIENQRDEGVTVADVEGGLPQAPAGFLAIVDLVGRDPLRWPVRRVPLTGLAGYAGNDPEPEFVDINDRNQAVVSLQENNHLVVVDLPTGRVVQHFDAGTVTLSGVDATRDADIRLTDTLTDVRREPDAVAWVHTRGGQRLIATANEGDLFGGSRGFSLLTPRGEVLWDSGSTLEELAARHGHLPEARSGARGIEPEAVEFGRFGGTDYLFVGSERGHFVAAYTLDGAGKPTFSQLLPSPMRPEGVLAIESRNLLIAAGEADEPSFGVRSTIMVYELSPGAAEYPEIVSAPRSTESRGGRPIAWAALSGMTAVPSKRSELLAAADATFADGRVYRIDASVSPAVIQEEFVLHGGSGRYDAEGIAVAPDGTWWIASEGNADSVPNRLLHVRPDGEVFEEVGLPPAIEACRATTTSRETLASGFEGIALRGHGRDQELVVAQQRGWDYTTPECEALDDDPLGHDGGEPRQTRLWRYRLSRGTWSHETYALPPVPAVASWVGLSELTAVPGGFLALERDNRSGDFATVKRLVHFSERALERGIRAQDKQALDLLPALAETAGWIPEKPEAVALTPMGQLFVATDNDGLLDAPGETRFLRLGQWPRRERTRR